MRTTLASALAACAIALAPFDAAHAQSEGAVTAWIGLITTPTGAFTPVAPPSTPAPARTAVGVQARYSHWQFDADDDNTTNLGAGLVVRRGDVRAALEGGWRSVRGCSDCDGLMAGLDVHVGLLARTFDGPVTLALGLNPAVGYGQPSGSDGDITSLSGALSLPVSLAVAAGSGLRLVPFVSPGFGVARLSGGGESSTGSRGMLSGGLTLAGVRAPVQLTASARKIFLDGAPTVLGVGLSVAR